MKTNFELSRHVSSFGYLLLYFLSLALVGVQDRVYLRVIQVGYIQKDEKVVVAFSKAPVRGNFFVHIAKTGESVVKAVTWNSEIIAWRTNCSNGPTIIGTIGATYMRASGESFPLKKERDEA